MSTKHNCKHPERGRNSEEGTSGYQKRLHDRGLGKAPKMETLDELRKRQERRIRETCTMGPDHETHKCNGHPWPSGTELGETEPVELVDVEPVDRNQAAREASGEARKPRPPRSARPRDSRPPRAPRDNAHPSPRVRAPGIGSPKGVNRGHSANSHSGQR